MVRRGLTHPQTIFFFVCFGIQWIGFCNCSQAERSRMLFTPRVSSSSPSL